MSASSLSNFLVHVAAGKMVVGQRDESKTQCIQRLRDPMPNPRCEPVPTVLDTRGNAMSSKSKQRGRCSGNSGTSFPRKRRALLDVSPPKWVDNGIYACTVVFYGMSRWLMFYVYVLCLCFRGLRSSLVHNSVRWNVHPKCTWHFAVSGVCLIM